VTREVKNQMMKMKLGLIAALAVFACGAVQAKDPVTQKLEAGRRVSEFDSKTTQRPAPQAYGGGNQYRSTVGVERVRVTPRIQGNAEVTTHNQPRIKAVDVKAGATIQVGK
jgi:hypothetical protein